MKMILLGTGDADGIPALGCDCAICKAALEGKEPSRTFASAAVLVKDTFIIIDPTPQIQIQLAAVGLQNKIPSGILITHLHYEHWAGLPLLHAFDRLGGGKQKFHVYSNAQTLNYIKNRMYDLLSATNRWIVERFKYIPIRQRFKIGSVTVETLVLDHQVPTTGYVLETGDLRIGYLLDTGPRFEEPDDLDIAVLDCTWAKKEGDGHMSIKDVMNIAPHLARKVVCSHIGHKNLFHRELDKIFRGTNVIIGIDGMKLNFKK